MSASVRVGQAVVARLGALLDAASAADIRVWGSEEEFTVTWWTDEEHPRHVTYTLTYDPVGGWNGRTTTHGRS